MSQLQKLIKKLIIQELHEAAVVVTNPAAQDALHRMGDIRNEIQSLNDRIKTLSDEYKELESTKEVSNLIEQLKENDRRMFRTEQYVMYVEKRGYTTTNYSYKEAYEFLLNKVNKATAKAAEIVKEATKTISTVSTKISVRHINALPASRRADLDEAFGDKLKTIWKSISNWFTKIISKFKKSADEFEKINKEFEKLKRDIS